jgi:dephospho-CoA kinase
MMRILGLTGSIGMGKTTAAKLLRQLGVPVHDADAEVHRLLGPHGAAVAAIGKAFPGTVRNGVVDRGKLGDLVFGSPNPAALRRLESIVHPLVRRSTARWLMHQARLRTPVVVLDVPLLFETGGPGRYDGVIVVSAPSYIQIQRVLRRPGMTPAKLAEILRRQMPDRAKRAQADAVIPGALGLRPTLRGLKHALRGLRRREVWRPGYSYSSTRGRSARTRA